MNTENSNHLLGETSLYLQQHVHNPVDWYPWSKDAFEKAKSENKLVLISIGYSSCHWCHVMERESFVDSATAKLMNDNFVCIKVDREERPDIDQIYMKAVQLMTGSAGWPLNCFTLPDGRPIYGGTYFANPTWKDLLEKLSQFYKESPGQAERYANELLQGIHRPEIVNQANESATLRPEILSRTVDQWKKYMDHVDGGPSRSPKFPLPNNYSFLLRYATEQKDEELLKYVHLTLKKMAYGGIYDQIGGGFSRYSTDSMWKVPHFEKMLYDNAQLISLYSKAYKAHPDPLYKQIVYETAAFLKREMSDGEGRYYSALDADSEGEEGKFYTWTKEELKALALPPIVDGKERELVDDYFNINERGLWEKENYILVRHKDNAKLAAKYAMNLVDFENYIADVKATLLKKRETRIRPGLDQKVITSWNALQATALCDAYSAFGDNDFLEEAKKCMGNIRLNAFNSSGFLLHVESQRGKMKTGFLEDYAFTISGMIALYQSTFDEQWLIAARNLTDEAIRQFHDNGSKLFWYNSNLEHNLISRNQEVTDNVIPSSNSEMANVLFVLGEYFDNENYTKLSNEMISAVVGDMPRWGSAYSNWANLLMNFTSPYKQTVIAGENAIAERKKIASKYNPNMLLAGTVSNTSELPILSNRFVPSETMIYVCENKTCKLPVRTAAEALKLIMQ
jgi:hypothetical protein